MKVMLSVHIFLQRLQSQILEVMNMFVGIQSGMEGRGKQYLKVQGRGPGAPLWEAASSATGAPAPLPAGGLRTCPLSGPALSLPPTSHNAFDTSYNNPS